MQTDWGRTAFHFDALSTTRFQLVNLTAVLRLDFFCGFVARLHCRFPREHISWICVRAHSLVRGVLLGSVPQPAGNSPRHGARWRGHLGASSWHQSRLHDPRLEMRQDKDGKGRWPSHTSNFKPTSKMCACYYMWRNANIYSLVLRLIMCLFVSWCQIWLSSHFLIFFLE